MDDAYRTFSDSEAATLVGKTIIVGITFEDHEHKLLQQEQHFGTIVRVNQKEGVVIRLVSGEERKLPPVLEALKPAPKGEYRFRSTGEVIVDPDLMTTWTSTKRDPAGDES